MLTSLLHGQSVDDTALLLHKWLTDTIFDRCSGADTAWFDPNTTLPWASTFRTEWRAIRNELWTWERGSGTIPAMTELEPLQSRLAPHGQWKTLWLQLYGKRTRISRDFPRTMAAISKTSIVSAMFSVLEPGRGLELHRGDSKAMWRYHLQLEVPAPQPGETEESQPLSLNIATKPKYKPGEGATAKFTRYHWNATDGGAEGGHWLFDDTFWHSVDNKRVSGRKVTLFMDVPRTDCGGALNAIIDFVGRHLMQRFSRARKIVAACDIIASRSGISENDNDEREPEDDMREDERADESSSEL